MGILTKEVEVRPRGAMIKYYREKGYDANYNQPLIVRVKDLPLNSHEKLEVLCDMCKENTMQVEYYNYNKVVESTGNYVCRDCSHEKASNTLEDKYGVRYGSQLPDFKEKYNQTCKEKYGEFYKKQFVEKSFQSFYERTGYNHPAQSPEVKDKMKQSSIEKYKVENPAKSKVVQDKMKQTCKKRYNCEYPTQSLIVRDKMSQTLYANSSQKVSKQQRYINDLYQGTLNFPIKHYNVDIYLSDDNLVIEYDGGGHMLNVVTGRETIEEYTRKEIIRNNIIKREGYKQMRIISSKDLLPSDQVLLQMLQDARTYFTQYPNHSWIEYNIDTSTVRNAENLKGSPYSFGSLRTIKDSDLNTIN